MTDKEHIVQLLRNKFKGCENLGSEIQEILDEFVVDRACAHATRVNNQGMDSQIDYLLYEMSFEDLRKHLESCDENHQEVV